MIRFALHTHKQPIFGGRQSLDAARQRGAQRNRYGSDRVTAVPIAVQAFPTFHQAHFLPYLLWQHWFYCKG
jgi:hypothetical protein